MNVKKMILTVNLTKNVNSSDLMLMHSNLLKMKDNRRM